MFQFPRSPSPPLCVQGGDDGTAAVGFPHSGTPGSKAVCASPGTIAACRALRRLPAPRHPPCARGILPARPGRRHAHAIHVFRWCIEGTLSSAIVVMIRCFPRQNLKYVRWSVGDRASLRDPSRGCALCGSQGTRGVAPGAGCRESSEGRAGRGHAPRLHSWDKF